MATVIVSGTAANAPAAASEMTQAKDAMLSGRARRRR